MRAWALALIIVILACAGVGLWLMHTQSPIAAAQSKAPQAQQQQTGMRAGIRRFDEAYHRHRAPFATVSNYSERARANRIVGIVGFLVFVFLTVPKNARGIGAFYRQMMEASPLSTDAGEVDNRRARRVLFYYLLFLLYEIVQFPLTIGHSNRVQFYSDLAIQIVLLILVVWSMHRLKRGLHERWRADPARQEKMDSWLGARLDGMNIRWRDIRGLALGVFIAGFAPAALANMTNVLDTLTAFGQRVAGG